MASKAVVCLARDTAEVELKKWGFGGQLVDDIVLVVSEVATNVVKHVKIGPIKMRVAREETGIRIEVGDVSAVPPCPKPLTLDDEFGGGGLHIIATLTANMCGHRFGPDGGKTVYGLVPYPLILQAARAAEGSAG